jgi:hypothetical protein
MYDKHDVLVLEVFYRSRKGTVFKITMQPKTFAVHPKSEPKCPQGCCLERAINAKGSEAGLISVI